MTFRPDVRALLIAPWVALAAGASPAVAGEPQISIAVPGRTAAWATVSVSVTIRNDGALPIVPLAVELTSDAGTLQAWGVEAHCQGGVHACAIHVEWAYPEPAREKAGQWEIWWGPAATQQATGPGGPHEAESSQRLLRLAPIAPGTEIQLPVEMIASYEHGGELTGRLRYVSVDPRRLALCSPGVTSRQPSGYVPCRPETAGVLYASADAADRASQTVTANASFNVIHPRFDLAAARARARPGRGSRLSALHAALAAGRHERIATHARRGLARPGGRAPGQLARAAERARAGRAHGGVLERAIAGGRRASDGPGPA